jgi:hypothetical protein
MKFLTEEMRKSGFSGLKGWREDETDMEINEEKDFSRNSSHQTLRTFSKRLKNASFNLNLPNQKQERD